jgi:hypothetical protein
MAQSLVKTTSKTIKKSAQYKAAKKIVEKTSAPVKAGVVLGIGTATAAGAYLVKKRGGGNPAVVGGTDLSDPAVAAGV